MIENESINLEIVILCCHNTVELLRNCLLKTKFKVINCPTWINTVSVDIQFNEDGMIYKFILPNFYIIPQREQ